MPGLRPSSFWIQEGMSTLFDWIADPHNWARMQKRNPVAGQRQSNLHREIFQLVNSKHNTKWTEAQVKSKISYIKKKYREAAALDSTGEEASVRQKQEEICPFFVRLHTVFNGSLSADPLPPRQTGSTREEIVSSNDSEEESSDLEVHDNNTFETASFAGTTLFACAHHIWSTFFEFHSPHSLFFRQTLQHGAS